MPFFHLSSFRMPTFKTIKEEASERQNSFTTDLTQSSDRRISSSSDPTQPDNPIAPSIASCPTHRLAFLTPCSSLRFCPRTHNSNHDNQRPQTHETIAHHSSPRGGKSLSRCPPTFRHYSNIFQHVLSSCASILKRNSTGPSPHPQPSLF